MDDLFTGNFLRRQSKGSDGVKNKYEIVDGQQRITIFSMVLLSVYYLATKRKVKATGKENVGFVFFFKKIFQ